MQNPFQKMIESQLGGMQEKLQRAMAELSAEIVEASSGGGVVTARATGQAELIEVVIDPTVVDPEDVELLQDLVTAAVREVMAKAMVLKKQKVMEATPLAQLGIDMPNLF
jgi:nucleoid-associated protein EbfC